MGVLLRILVAAGLAADAYVHWVFAPDMDPGPNAPSGVIARACTYRGCVTHTVFHRGYGIELNLTEEDLEHPGHPGLLDELHRNYKPDCCTSSTHTNGTVEYVPDLWRSEKSNDRPACDACQHWARSQQ